MPERYEVVYTGNILRDYAPLSIYIWINSYPNVVQHFENQRSRETAHLYLHHFFLFLEFGCEACYLFFSFLKTKQKNILNTALVFPVLQDRDYFVLPSSFQISGPYKSIKFTIYKSVHFYSVVITTTNGHILSFSQVLSGVKKDYFAYAKLST